jgi:hypothetical protein
MLMRYLKVTVQDRVGNGRPDSVLLQFYESACTPGEDVLVNKAFALDFDADGNVDYKMGDVTNDGRENSVDQRLLKTFANACLKLNWFNPGASTKRYLKIFAEDFAEDGSPDTVRLHFHEGNGKPTDRTLTRTAAAYDTDNNGTLDWSIHFDVDNDGDTDAVDRELVSLLSDTYLKFKWK